MRVLRATQSNSVRGTVNDQQATTQRCEKAGAVVCLYAALWVKCISTALLLHYQQMIPVSCHCTDWKILQAVLWSLPSVLWRCWLDGRKGIRPVKNRVVGCWHGYLWGARCRLAYGPANATATHCPCFSKIQIGFTFLVPAHLGSPGKRAIKQVCVCATESRSTISGFIFSSNHLLGLSFLAHQHKAAGGKTRLDIQNYGCNGNLLFSYHMIVS